MRFSTKGFATLLTGACMLGSASLVYAQAAEMTKQVAAVKAATDEAIKLLANVKDEATAKAAAAQVEAAIKKQDAAEAAVGAAMQKVDPKSQSDGKLVEKAFTDIQAANQAISDAQMKAIERQAAAKAQAAAAAKPAAPAPAAAPAPKK